MTAHKPNLRPPLTMAVEVEESEQVYRPAKPLPFELRQHCAIYFEEKLCRFSSPDYPRDMDANVSSQQTRRH
jgi:hypothetical protein